MANEMRVLVTAARMPPTVIMMGWATRWLIDQADNTRDM